MEAPGVPSLAEVALNKVCEQIHTRPFRPEASLKPAVASECFARLPLPTADNLDILASYVENDEYWKRAVGGKKVEEHGLLHQRMYFEQKLQDILLSTRDEQEIINKLRPIADCIYTIKLCRLMHDIPIDVVCQNLPNLMSIDVKHATSSGLIQSIPKALSSSPNLTTLVLTESQVSDADVELILARAIQTPTLLHLDFSQNRIGPEGVQTIADSLLSSDSILSCLDLSGNEVSSQGASILGQALATNESLLSLSLRLNNIGDEGGADLCDGLRGNTTLRNLNLAANSLGSSTASSLLQVLDATSSGLESVCVTSTTFTDEDLTRLGQCDNCSVDARTINEPTKATHRSLASEMPCSK